MKIKSASILQPKIMIKKPSKNPERLVANDLAMSIHRKYQYFRDAKSFADLFFLQPFATEYSSDPQWNLVWKIYTQNLIRKFTLQKMLIKNHFSRVFYHPTTNFPKTTNSQLSFWQSQYITQKDWQKTILAAENVENLSEYVVDLKNRNDTSYQNQFEQHTLQTQNLIQRKKQLIAQLIEKYYQTGNLLQFTRNHLYRTIHSLLPRFQKTESFIQANDFFYQSTQNESYTTTVQSLLPILFQKTENSIQTTDLITQFTRNYSYRTIRSLLPILPLRMGRFTQINNDFLESTKNLHTKNYGNYNATTISNELYYNADRAMEFFPGSSRVFYRNLWYSLQSNQRLSTKQCLLKNIYRFFDKTLQLNRQSLGKTTQSLLRLQVENRIAILNKKWKNNNYRLVKKIKYDTQKNFGFLLSSFLLTSNKKYRYKHSTHFKIAEKLSLGYLKHLQDLNNETTLKRLLSSAIESIHLKNKSTQQFGEDFVEPVNEDYSADHDLSATNDRFIDFDHNRSGIAKSLQLIFAEHPFSFLESEQNTSHSPLPLNNEILQAIESLQHSKKTMLLKGLLPRLVVLKWLENSHSVKKQILKTMKQTWNTKRRERIINARGSNRVLVFRDGQALKSTQLAGKKFVNNRLLNIFQTKNLNPEKFYESIWSKIFTRNLVIIQFPHANNNLSDVIQTKYVFDRDLQAYKQSYKIEHYFTKRDGMTTDKRSRGHFQNSFVPLLLPRHSSEVEKKPQPLKDIGIGDPKKWIESQKKSQNHHNIKKIADRVYGLIVKKITIERERRGLR